MSGAKVEDWDPGIRLWSACIVWTEQMDCLPNDFGILVWSSNADLLGNLLWEESKVQAAYPEVVS